MHVYEPRPTCTCNIWRKVQYNVKPAIEEWTVAIAIHSQVAKSLAGRRAETG